MANSFNPGEEQGISQVWIQVAKIIGNNKDALVMCPMCQANYLKVWDAYTSDPTRYERWFQCPTCKGGGAMLMTQPGGDSHS